MSVSVTNSQTLKNTAATLSALMTSPPLDRNLDGIRNAAFALLGPQSIKLEDSDALAAKLYNVFVKANDASLKARYVDGEWFNAAPTLETLSVKEHAIPVISNNKDEQHDALIFFYESVSNQFHGLFDERVSRNIVELGTSLSILSTEISTAAALNRAPEAQPTVSEIAESLIRLTNNGDYLYGEQSYLHSLMRKIPMISSQIPQEGGDDVLLTLYYQAVNYKNVFTLPFGDVEWDLKRVRSNTTRYYALAGDIPHARQHDADNINTAFLKILSELNVRDLIDPDGRDLKEGMGVRAKRVLQSVAHIHFADSCFLKRQAFGNRIHLTFDAAMRVIREINTPSIEYLLVSTTPEKLLIPKVDGHPQFSEKLHQIQAMAKTGVMITRPEEWPLIKSKIPEMKAVSLMVSKEENRDIGTGYRADVVTAGTCIMRATVMKAYEELGLPCEDSALTEEQIARRINTALSRALPGFGDETLRAVSDSFSNTNLAPAGFLWALEKELSPELKTMLKTRAEITLPSQGAPAPTHEQPVQQTLEQRAANKPR